MLKNKRLLLVPVLLLLVAVVVLGMKIAFPSHRLIALVLLGLGWVPLIVSYRINRRLLRVQKHRIKKKARPFLPHAVVAVLLLVAFYVTWALFPVERSPIAGMPPEELRAELASDLQSYQMLCNASDDLRAEFRSNGLLGRKVDSLSLLERKTIRSLWRDGAMAFLEFDLLKDKYRGFYQIDYVAEPRLHADAFLLAYMAHIAQYEACLAVVGMVEDGFMATLLNEEGEGIPADGFFFMKQRLTHPNVILRINAAAAYYDLVKRDVSIDAETIADFNVRRKALVEALGANAGLLVENPLAVLERVAFETVLPVQEEIALQMSHVRTTQRDYLITPDILDHRREALRPGDLLIQRRNWHMTNIGIPGFWPHVALYVGTPSEIEAYFSELGFLPQERMRTLYPEAFEALDQTDEDGYPNRVIEAIRPGVVFQSLETSARCDYLGVVRPNLPKAEKFKALLGAFAHFGKPYDLNFDFTTDNALVCSELVYKAYRAGGPLPLHPQVVNGRRLLPPNQLAEQAVAHMGAGEAFEFVLFLDAVEKKGAVVERDAAAFSASWQRPKWDLMQQ